VAPVAPVGPVGPVGNVAVKFQAPMLVEYVQLASPDVNISPSTGELGKLIAIVAPQLIV
jgi:hypothetical protein